MKSMAHFQVLRQFNHCNIGNLLSIIINWIWLIFRFSDKPGDQRCAGSKGSDKTPRNAAPRGGSRKGRKKGNEEKVIKPKPFPQSIINTYIKPPLPPTNYNPDTEAEPLVDNYKHIDEVRHTTSTPQSLG